MAKDDDERVSRLLGEEMQRGFWEMHERDVLTESEIGYLRTTYCMEHPYQAELLRIEEKYSQDGHDPGTDPDFLKEFWEVMEDQYNQLLRSLDPLTRASALASRQEKWFKSFNIFNRELWISWIKPGNDGYVYGVKDSGKSDMMCLIAEILMENGGNVVSCIPLTKEVDRYLYCTRGTQLLRTTCNLMLHGEQCLVLLDEGFFHATGETPLKPEVMRWRQFMRLFRKLGITSLTASQRHSDILSDVRTTAAIRIKKLSRDAKHRAHIQLTGKIDGRSIDFSDYVSKIPRTKLPFKTEALAGFIMDFEPNQLLDYMADVPMEENQYSATLGWLDKQGFHFTKEEKVYLAGKMSGVGLSQGRIGEVLDVSQKTVSNWLSYSGQASK